MYAPWQLSPPPYAPMTSLGGDAWPLVKLLRQSTDEYPPRLLVSYTAWSRISVALGTKKYSMCFLFTTAGKINSMCSVSHSTCSFSASKLGEMYTRV